MDVKTWTYLIVGLSFASYIGIAIWSRARTTGDFYVAGKGVHPVANGTDVVQIGVRVGGEIVMAMAVTVKAVFEFVVVH